MTDELEKLKAAFRQERASDPDPDARHAAIHAAMLQFEELEQEKSETAGQGSAAPVRLKTRAGEFAARILRRFSMTLTRSRLSYILAGSVSLAAIVLVVNLNSGNLPGLSSWRGKQQEQPASAGGGLLSLHSGESEVPVPAPPMEELAEPDVSYDVAADSSAAPASGAVAPMAAAPSLAARKMTDGRARSMQKTRELRSVGGLVSSNIAPGTDALTPVYQDQGRDRFSNVPDNPVKRVADDPVSTFSADVDTASYAFIRGSLNMGVLPPKDAVRIEEMINYFDYDYPVPADRSQPFKADVSIMPTPWNAETRLLRIGIKGYEIERAEAPKANLVFLIDTSGSMDAPDKLPLLRQAFRMLVSNLRPDDLVSIVTYAGSAGTVLEPTKASETGKIMAALDNLSAGGSTAGGEGIRQAYQLAEEHMDKTGINRVILATDGDFNVGISDPEQLKDFVERKRDTGVTLSVLGFGRGNYNDLLMQELAQNGNGNASYIDTLSEARKVLVDEASSTLFPIAKDVKFQVEFNPAEVSEYRLIGYETRKLEREDFNNDKVDAGDIGAGHTVTALYEFRPASASGALIEPLRYQSEAKPASADTTDEIAFLKIRYKLPDEDVSKLITTPIGADAVKDKIPDASNDTRFAAAVAGFGEILKGGKYTGTYSLDDVLALAASARGNDPYNYRGSFLELVRLAKSAGAMEPLKK
ncbi:vWA domain-containing protein [Roseibium aggregatum]|uniref:VWA domain-containing protein n=1 Tax=Roseibium aggregatum TaxID=187304 RepID=A0A926P1C7_9HYPH|nr:VWA domain-containing protein [Roseibium aggregatum]MBD1547638.1 VWA domain-containing protein [Roseibium aggregatum]